MPKRPTRKASMPKRWAPKLSKLSKRRIALGAGGCAIAGIVAAALLLGSGTSRPAGYNNVSRNYRVCLLSNTAGGTSGTGTAVRTTSAGQAIQGIQAVDATWAGLKRAAGSGRVNAERLPLSATSAPAAAPYFNGALQQHCGLIVSVGPDMSTAVDAAAAAHRGQQYLLVGGASTLKNVHTIGLGSASTITSETYAMVMSLANA